MENNSGFMVPYKTKIPGTDVEYEMVPIPGGTFFMGSPKNEAGRSGNEGPQIKVKVRPFWMGKYEVTWNEFHEYMDLTEVFMDFERLKIRLVTNDNQIDAISAPSSLSRFRSQTLWPGHTTSDIWPSLRAECIQAGPSRPAQIAPPTTRER